MAGGAVVSGKAEDGTSEDYTNTMAVEGAVVRDEAKTGTADDKTSTKEGSEDIALSPFTVREEAPVTLKAYAMCAFAAFGGIFFGYDTGWMGGVMAMPYFVRMITGKEYPADVYPDTTSKEYAAYKLAYKVGASDQSLMTAILSAGTFFGALCAGDISDRIGRRPTIIAGCFIFTIGCILEVVAVAVPLMSAGRAIAGFGIGFISAIIILYMSEIAPKKFRGTLVAGYQWCITIGSLLSNCVVYASQKRDDTGSYRIPIAVQFLWAIILATGLFLLPESPRYFVKRGKLDQAAQALSSVRNQPIDSDWVQDELAEIIANNEYEMQVIPQTNYMGGWYACFKGDIRNGSSNLRRTLLGMGLQMFQQLTGINFIKYFGTVFFQSLGTIDDPFLITLITTLVNVCSTPGSFYTIERFGRRRILICGGAAMVVCQFIVAIVGVTAGTLEKGNDDATRAMIAFICINIACYANSWGPAPWVVVGEVFNLPIRSRGVGLSTASNWAWNCVIAVITPYLVGTEKGQANLGAKVFFMWGSLCITSFSFAYFVVPETRGLSLEQIDKMLEESTPLTSNKWKPHSTFAEEMGLAHKAHGLDGDVIHVEDGEKIDVAPEKKLDV